MISPWRQNNDLAYGAALLPVLAVRLYADDADDAVLRVALLVLMIGIAYGWSTIFAQRLHRPLGRPQLHHAHFAVLLSVLLPGPVGWAAASLAASFGWVFGREVFGGKSLLSPALLALAFAIFSFPEGRFEARDILYTYPEPLLALACLPGAAWLLWKRLLAWPVVGGAVLAALLVAFIASPSFAPPWPTHVMLGTFAIGVLFIAAAPDGAPQGRWAQALYGVLVGALIVIIRLKNPDQPDGVAFAILLATLFAPLLDRALRGRTRHG